MRGEWDGNNDRSGALRVSFRSFLFFSTNRQVHRPVMILTWNALTTLNYLCFTVGYTLTDLVFHCSAEDPTLFRLTKSVLGRKNSSINSLYQSLITIKTHERCIFCIAGLVSSDRGGSEAANGYGASGAITLQTKFLRRTVEPPRHLTSPKKSFGQSRFATGGFSGS